MSSATDVRARSTFAHSHNSDHTFDSVCLACFTTVGTELNEVKLFNLEEQHRCAVPEISEDRIEFALRTSRECVRSTSLMIQDSKRSMAHTRELIRDSKARFGKQN